MDQLLSHEIIFEFGVQAFTATAYSQYQHSIMMRIYKYRQGDIRDAITQQANGGVLKFTPAENAEGMRHVKIPFSKLEPHKGHYPRLQKALEEMQNIPIHVPFKNRSGQLRYGTYPRLFTVTFTTENRQRYATLHLRTDTLFYFLNNSMGYHKIDLKTYFMFNRLSSRQLFRLYQAYFVRGGNKLKPEALANLLCGVDKCKNNSELEHHYLTPAMEELQKAYENGLCDIRFRFHSVFPENFPHLKWCDKVVFSFIDRRDEHPTAARLSELTDYQAKVKLRLIYLWEVEEKTAVNISSKIRPDMIPDLDTLFEHKLWFAKKRKSEGKPLTNPAGYIVKSLKDFFEQYERDNPTKEK